MKPPITLLLLLVLTALPVSNLSAAMQASEGRTIGQLNLIPTTVLKRYISPKFYKTLLISPVKGWVVVRGKLVGTRISGARIIHSELGGKFDALALDRAKDVQLAGSFSVDNRTGKTILMHLLIYEIADGTMALSFPHLDGPGGNQQKYFGCTKLTVLKADGKWTEIKGPPGLQDEGWAVRTPGLENNVKAILRLERIPGS
jgi:hypothetical protein